MTATVDHVRLKRGRLIRAIKTAERALGIDEDGHRSVVGVVAGRDSLTQCDLGKLKAILTHLNQRSGYRRSEADGTTRRLDQSPEARKLRALWLLLHQLGAVRNPSEAALAAYAKRMAGVDDLHWSHASIASLIEGLKGWAARALPAALEQRMARLSAASRIDPRNTVGGLLARAAPTLRPDTFDALHAAWEHLEELENGRVADPRR